MGLVGGLLLQACQALSSDVDVDLVCRQSQRLKGDSAVSPRDLTRRSPFLTGCEPDRM